MSGSVLASAPASGTVPEIGWVVNLHPYIYVRAPTTWEIEALGVRPDGPLPQVITEWEASVDMNLGKDTEEVAVIGRNKTITKRVPW